MLWGLLKEEQAKSPPLEVGAFTYNVLMRALAEGGDKGVRPADRLTGATQVLRAFDEALGAGVAVSVLATGLNAVLSWQLMAAGRKYRSPALAADGRHILSDVVTTAGVLAGVGLARATGWWRLDPLLACFVAVNILWMGWKLVRHSVGGLMDEVLDEAEVARVRGIAERVAREGNAVAVEGFRLRHTGTSGQCDMTLRVPGEMEVRVAHAICDRIEEALRADDPQLGVVVHVEPAAPSSSAAI
jgi:cation diffusion facilitator family transporter